VNQNPITNTSGEAIIQHHASGGELNEGLKCILDTIPQSVILTNSNGQVWFMNKKALSLLGKKRQVEKPVPWHRLLNLYLDDDNTPYPRARVPLQLALNGETTQEEEMFLRRDGGSSGSWISMISHPLFRQDGKVNGSITYLRDVTYRKRMDALYELSHHIAGAGTDTKNLSRAVTKFTSDVIGDLSIMMLMDNDDAELTTAAYFDTDPAGSDLMDELLMNNEKFGEESSLVTGVIRSGKALLIPSIDPEKLKLITSPVFKEYIERMGVESILVIPLLGRGGVLGAISLFRRHGKAAFNADDVSFLMDVAFRTALAIENFRLFDSLRLEAARRLTTKLQLDTSEERFHSIFHSTALGIKVLDVAGNIIQTNKAFQEMIGYSEIELLGRRFSEFLYNEDVPRALKLINDLKRTGNVQYLFEHRAVHKNDGLVWVKTTFSPVKVGKHSKRLVYIVGIIENITEQKQNEREMRELRDRLHTSIDKERLRLAQELHDNPMQSLYTVLYNVENLRALADPLMSEKLENITSDIKLVLDDLRATAKELRPPTLFSFGLESAIRSYAEDFTVRYPNLTISLSLAEDRQLLPEGIRLALFRIFQQALMNVMRHSDATAVKVLFSFDAEEVRLEIADNGKGFDVPSNWIEFVRKGHYGLAGAVERANSMGGFLQVRSEPGKMTTVIATIPWKNHHEPGTGNKG
jgi:PAS domain S-box-containing protein